MAISDLLTVQQLLGIQFNDLYLLQVALTHRSFVNEYPDDALDDNERLEFLGDAVLDFVVGEWLFNRFPEMREGRLTRLRSSLVRMETLADFGEQCQIGEMLRLGKGEESSGGRTRTANLCRAYEALVGAIYLDQGLDTVRNFVAPFLQPALRRILQNESDKDAKSRLQEWCQAHFGTTPDYHTVGTRGPDHKKEFTIEVEIDGRVYGRGTGHNKQSAAQRAAQQALKIIEEDEDFPDNGLRFD